MRENLKWIEEFFPTICSVQITQDAFDASNSQSKHPITSDELIKLEEVVKQVSSLGLLCKVQSREVVQLLDVLLNHISVSEGICVCIEDESKRDVVQFIRSGLRAVHLSLVLLGAENMPVEVYREDFIDRIVHFIKFQATHNLLPISVTSNNQPGQISAGMEQGQTSNSSASTIKDKRRQKKS